MQKKVAAFHDISGFGRCALTIAMPVIAACGIYCCPVPSAVLSGHTAYKGVTFRDLTDDLDGFIESWVGLGVKLDAVYSGYLGSEIQVRQVLALKDKCGADGCMLIADPVMGDNGKAYSIAGDPAFITAIRELASKADIITPNLTECALLLGMEPNAYKEDRESVISYMEELAKRGAGSVVVTGLEENGLVGAAFLDGARGETGFVFHERVPVYYPGTGDLFTSVLTGRLLGREGCTLGEAVFEAANFVKDCAAYTNAQGTPNLEGVQFEKLLYKLTERS